jgi:predicted small lipoprotein YifL
MTKPLIAGSLLLIVLLVQGCGRKGPLFMQQPMPSKNQPAATIVQPTSSVSPATPIQNTSTPNQPETK